MNTATLLHRTAMEYYDLAAIYKAKGRPEFFKDYRTKAWLLEKEAALQFLADPKDYTFKYLVIHSAGLLGYDLGNYEEAQKVLELGLMANPSEPAKFQMEELLAKIDKKLKKETQKVTDKNIFISGTLTSADVENKVIKIREGSKKDLRAISVSAEMIRQVIRFYLGELVRIQLNKDALGNYFLKNITKAA